MAKMQEKGIETNVIGNLDSGPQIKPFYRGYLFEANIEFQKVLADGRISKILYNEFIKNDIQISKHSEVKKLSSQRWNVISGKKKYIIIKELVRTEINVYKDNVKLFDFGSDNEKVLKGKDTLRVRKEFITNKVKALKDTIINELNENTWEIITDEKKYILKKEQILGLKVYFSNLNTENIDGFFPITTHLTNLRAFHGKKYYYIPAISDGREREDGQVVKETEGVNDFADTWYNEFNKTLPMLPSAGNIGGALAILAYFLGMGPIFLLGMDFDHTGREHETAADRNFKVKGAKGKEYVPDQAMFCYAFSFRRLIMKLNEENPKNKIDIINLSDGILHGPYLKDMTWKGFEAFNKELEDIDYKKYWRLRPKSERKHGGNK